MAAALAIQSRPASRAETSRLEETNTRTYDDGLSAFMSVRPRLFGIAYRMLGSAVEAEDVVQDAWVRWQTADRGVVRDAAAFSRPRQPGWRSTSCSQHARDGKRAAGSRCRNQRTRAPTLECERNEARPWNWESSTCWRSYRPRNGLRTSFERRSTTRTATSRTSSGSKWPTRGRW